MNTPNITRRHFFNDCAVGTGKIALASLLAESAYGAEFGKLQRCDVRH